MPGTTGLELCEELKADPATREIPVILLTGSTGGTSAAAKRVGADAFVRKPFSPLELLAVAERLPGGPFRVPLCAPKKRGGGAPGEPPPYPPGPPPPPPGQRRQRAPPPK